MTFTFPPEEPGNVTPMNDAVASEDKVLEMVGLGARPEYCDASCRNVFTDDVRRILICRDCGKAIEPFTYMQRWAREGDQRMDHLKTLRLKINITTGELSMLEKRLDSVRGKLKREGHTQPEVERMAYRQEMDSAHYQAGPRRA